MKLSLSFKSISIGLTILTVALIATIFGFNILISKYAIGKTYSSVLGIPPNKVGLVLGTSKTLKNGQLNLYFKYRIEATVTLYNHHKIDFVLVSGDNGTKSYDEPTDFKDELVKRGIPENRIFLDYAGFRTLDSVVRAKKIFGQTQLPFISQKFHNERAIYLAKINGIHAIGYNAKDVSKRYGLKVIVREYFARTKVFIDYIFNVQPKFLGAAIQIN
jgi:SanA protein